MSEEKQVEPHRRLTTETEIDEYASRDRVRRAAQVAASELVRRVFNTAPKRALSLDALWNEARKAVDPIIEQFRQEELARAIERLGKHQGELGQPDDTDISDLTCEDP